MTAIEKVVEKLKRYEGLKCQATERSIVIQPRTDDGFLVALDIRDGEYTVSFEAWHEEFESEADALECFAFGLSDQCRLQIDLRGDFAYRWTLESKLDDEWVGDSATGLLLFPFWRRRRTVYRQNAWFAV